MTTYRFTPAAIPNGDLDETTLQPPVATPIGADVVVRRTATFLNDEKSIISGTWEGEPGKARFEFTDRYEFIYVVSGRMTVTENGGEPVEIGPGDAVMFQLGWVGEWHILETLRKAYTVIFV